MNVLRQTLDLLQRRFHTTIVGKLFGFKLTPCVIINKAINAYLSGWNGS